MVTLTGSDPETCELTFSILEGPTNGELSGVTDADCAEGDPNTDSAVVTYTRYAGFTGEDSFTFRANDGQEDGEPVYVEIAVET